MSVRWRTALRPAEPFDGDSAEEGAALSSLPSSYHGLMVGLAMISAVSWLCAAALLEAVDPGVVIVLLTIVMLVLLLIPSAVNAGGTIEISRAAAASQYGGFVALGILGWSTVLWAPGESWAAMAATGVLQTGYTLGVGLVALQARLAVAEAD